MAISHDETIVANHSLAFRSSAAMNGDKFTDAGIIANYSQTVFAFKLQVLRYVADNSSRMDVAFIANSCSRMDCRIAVDNRTIANNHILINSHKRTNSNIFAY